MITGSAGIILRAKERKRRGERRVVLEEQLIVTLEQNVKI